MREPDRDKLSDLEARLNSWQPSAGSLDRESMLYEAGRASVVRARTARDRVRPWQVATAASVTLALGLGLGWLREHGRAAVAERYIVLSQERPGVVPEVGATGIPVEEASGPGEPASYLELARQAKLGSPSGIGDSPPESFRGISAGPAISPGPIRARDFDRVFDL